MTGVRVEALARGLPPAPRGIDRHGGALRRHRVEPFRDGAGRVRCVRRRDRHYLHVDPVKRLVVHHRRAAQAIETRIVSEGMLTFDPPGLGVPLADLFDDA